MSVFNKSIDDKTAKAISEWNGYITTQRELQTRLSTLQAKLNELTQGRDEIGKALTHEQASLEMMLADFALSNLPQDTLGAKRRKIGELELELNHTRETLSAVQREINNCQKNLNDHVTQGGWKRKRVWSEIFVHLQGNEMPKGLTEYIKRLVSASTAANDSMPYVTAPMICPDFSLHASEVPEVQKQLEQDFGIQR